MTLGAIKPWLCPLYTSAHGTWSLSLSLFSLSLYLSVSTVHNSSMHLINTSN